MSQAKSVRSTFVGRIALLWVGPVLLLFGSPAAFSDEPCQAAAVWTAPPARVGAAATCAACRAASSTAAGGTAAPQYTHCGRATATGRPHDGQDGLMNRVSPVRPGQSTRPYLPARLHERF